MEFEEPEPGYSIIVDRSFRISSSSRFDTLIRTDCSRAARCGSTRMFFGGVRGALLALWRPFWSGIPHLADDGVRVLLRDVGIARRGESNCHMWRSARMDVYPDARMKLPKPVRRMSRDYWDGTRDDISGWISA